MTNQNLKFLVCCANGSGSSLMAQMALEKVLKKNNIEAEVACTLVLLGTGQY